MWARNLKAQSQQDDSWKHTADIQMSNLSARNVLAQWSRYHCIMKEMYE